VNAIKDELDSFKESILNNTEPRVNIDDGYRALNLAQLIIEKINSAYNNL
jgi:hypothetical protein